MLWDQLCYVFVKNGHCQAFQLFLHSVFCLLVIPQALASQKINISFRNCEILVSLSFACTFFQLTHGQREVPTTAVAVHHSLAVSERLTPFPHIFFVRCTFSKHSTTCQRISVRRTFLLFKHLNAELNPICHLLALLGAHLILHLSMISVKNPMTDST